METQPERRLSGRDSGSANAPSLRSMHPGAKAQNLEVWGGVPPRRCFFFRIFLGQLS